MKLKHISDSLNNCVPDEVGGAPVLERRADLAVARVARDRVVVLRGEVLPQGGLLPALGSPPRVDVAWGRSVKS